MKHESRIKPNATVVEALEAITEGDVYSVNLCRLLLAESPQIDPAAPFGPMSPLVHLDTLGIYGERLCYFLAFTGGASSHQILTVLRAVQLGHVSESELNAWIDSAQDIPTAVFDALHRRVCADVPGFAA